MRTLKELFDAQLQDAHSAESQLAKALPRLAAAARAAELRMDLEAHLAETRDHVMRLEEVCRSLGTSPSGAECKAMRGLIAEADEMIALEGDEHVRDAGLICAAQKIEHYEIALYGTLCSWADELGLNDVRRLLAETLAEEKAGDGQLTDLAEMRLNLQARH
jgi:ferritin-like metal-binding protein YciE